MHSSMNQKLNLTIPVIQYDHLAYHYTIPDKEFQLLDEQEQEHNLVKH